jgi:hypothetical protein
MLSDYVHKAVNPSTYQCSLCRLTHSNFGMKAEWKAFIEMLEGEKIFLYKDDFLKQYPEHTGLAAPAVFIEEGGELRQLFSASVLNSYQSLRELQEALNDKLSKL